MTIINNLHSKNKRKKSSYTSKMVNSPKLWLFISCVIAAIIDIAVMVDLGISQVSFLFMLCPMLLLIVDMLFAVCIVTSNFRFKYAIAEIAVYVFFVIALAIATILSNMGVGSMIMMSQFAIIAWLVSHCVVIIASILSYLIAAKIGIKFGKIATAPFLLVAVIVASLYIAFCAYAGFFGQQSSYDLSNRTRPLIYEYEEFSDTYSVVGVARGKGEKIVIPQKFNNKEVESIDCTIFNTEGVKDVTLANKAYDFTNITELDTVADDLVVKIDKSRIDYSKKTLYNLAMGYSNEDIVALANKFVPTGLNANQRYVSFAYDLEALNLVDGKILPTWINNVGSVFDITKHADDFDDMEFLLHSDPNTAEDLHWSFVNNKGKILNNFVGSDGVSIQNKPISKNETIEFKFHKIFKVYIGEDNDTLYETDDEYKYDDGFDFRYTIANNANKILDNVPTRKGFDLTWGYGEGKVPFDNLQQLLKGSKDTDIKIYPKWALQAPNVTLIADNTNIVYGDDINFMTEVDTKADGLTARYKWLDSNNNLIGGQTNSNMILTTPTPTQSGVYTVEVTTSSNTVTSLTATSTAKIKVTIGKRGLELGWDLPTDRIYSGTNKPIIATPKNAVVGDNVSLQIRYTLGGASQGNVKNAGVYTITATINGADTEKYYIAKNQSISLEILKKEVEITWQNTTLVYDGTAQSITANSFNGVGGDGIIAVNVSGTGTNVGTYTATAQSTNSNYTIKNRTCNFSIDPKTIIVTSWGTKQLTYNGKVQYPIIAGFTGEVNGERDIVKGLFSYSVADGVSAKDHTVVATMKKGNYKFANDSVSQNYTIGKKSLTISHNGVTSKVYDGTGFVYNPVVNGLAETDTLTEVFSSINGGQTSADVGTYSISAIIEEGVKYDNYQVTIEPATFKITARDLRIAHNGEVAKDYDGKTMRYNPFVQSGLANGDSLSEIATIGGETSSANAGSYEVTPTINGGAKYKNYNIIASKANFTINKKAITFNWQQNRTFTYDGTTKLIVVTGVNDVVSGEESAVISSITYAGGAINAGEHTMVASLPSGSNYKVTDGSDKQTFTINKAKLVLVWQEETEFEYDGTEHGLVVTSVIGKIGDDIVKIEYTGFASAIGEYTMTASTTNSNYYIENPTATFTIVQSNNQNNIFGGNL